MSDPEFFAKCSTIVVHREGEETAREIDVAALVKLYDVCTAFAEKMRITCPEVIHQSDRVIVGAYGFLEDVYDCVGYLTEDEDE